MNTAERAGLSQDNDDEEEEGLTFGHPSLYWYVISATNPSSIYQQQFCDSPVPLVTFQTFRTHRLAPIRFHLLSESPVTQW
jgi:hypothetical protein